MSAHGRRPDVLIVGAGVVGAACALALARENLRVLLLDAGFPGGGSTSAAMGHIVVMDDSGAQLALTARSRRLWDEMADDMPSDCELEVRGTLWIADGEAELAAAAAKREVYAAHGVASSLVDEGELSRLEPFLRRGLAGALYVPDDAVLYPPAATRWLASLAASLGVEVRDRCAVEEIGPGWVRVRRAGGTSEVVEAGAVVNAAGVDAPLLTPGLPIVPRKGHLVITERYPGIARSQLVELGYLRSAHGTSSESVAFNVQPRATGQLLIGSSRELVGRDPRVNEPVLAAMVRRAVALLPALTGCAAIRAWTGFRPATPDNLPLIGRWEPVEHLWIAAGHEGLGITTATGTAELIAAGILGRTPPIDATPFHPGRVLAAGCAEE